MENAIQEFAYVTQEKDGASRSGVSFSCPCGIHWYAEDEHATLAELKRIAWHLFHSAAKKQGCPHIAQKKERPRRTEPAFRFAFEEPSRDV